MTAPLEPPSHEPTHGSTDRVPPHSEADGLTAQGEDGEGLDVETLGVVEPGVAETRAPGSSSPLPPGSEDVSSTDAAPPDEAFTLEELPPDFWDAPPAPSTIARPADARARPSAPAEASSPPPPQSAAQSSAQSPPSARARTPSRPPPGLSPRVAEVQSLFPGRVLRVEALEPASAPEELAPETSADDGLEHDLENDLEDTDEAVQEGLFDD